MADIDRLIGFMAIMQVPFMNDPDALAYIEEVKTVLKQMKAQDAGWISADNRPPSQGRYLVYGLTNFVPDHIDQPNAYWEVKIAYWSNVFGWDCKVKYWMPLSEPPKEG